MAQYVEHQRRIRHYILHRERQFFNSATIFRAQTERMQKSVVDGPVNSAMELAGRESKGCRLACRQSGADVDEGGMQTSATELAHTACRP